MHENKTKTRNLCSTPRILYDCVDFSFELLICIGNRKTKKNFSLVFLKSYYELEVLKRGLHYHPGKTNLVYGDHFKFSVTFFQDAGVTILGTVPSLVKAWRKPECMNGIDWTRIR